MRSRKHLFGLAVLVAVGTAVPALAQPSGGTQQYPVCTRAITAEESEAAHRKYIAGKVDYDERNWDSAIVNFVDAYKKDCTKHELLVILSRAYEGKGDLAEAIRALETYLQRAPTAPDRSTYETRIANMRRELAKQQAPATASAPPTATASATPTASASSTSPPPGGEVHEHTVLPWIVVTVGGAGLVTGIILLAAAPSLPPNCDGGSATCAKVPPKGVAPPLAEESDTQLQMDKDRAAQHVTFQTVGTVFVIAGVGVIAGGLLWHFVEPTGPTTGKPMLTPQVVPGYAGMSLGGAF